jgi:hypothetical protein
MATHCTHRGNLNGLLSIFSPESTHLQTKFGQNLHHGRTPRILFMSSRGDHAPLVSHQLPTTPLFFLFSRSYVYDEDGALRGRARRGREQGRGEPKVLSTTTHARGGASGDGVFHHDG